jgi:N-methylhydantoinase A/oxoprolinase/acetone carboxylase beta subunit
VNRVGIDIGGTFTDIVVYDIEERTLRRAKVMTDYEHPERSFMSALEQAGVDPAEVALLLHGTTLVTNLLIQRNGARVGLLTTRGYRDLLDIQLSIRPNPFDYVQWTKPPALIPRELRLEIAERTTAAGETLTRLEEEEVAAAARRLADLGAESIAICFLHSFVNDENERRAGEIVRETLPGMPISLSCEVDPTIREYERTSTTVINSYAQPAVDSYIAALESRLPLTVRYMHSGGGIIPAETARKFPVLLASSGPAAGVLAGVYLARNGDAKDLITFDMGGTSCDVSLIRDGSPAMTDSIDVDWNIPARTLSVDVNSVGAGGGSIASIDSGGALMVGPRSAGARPGPVSYGFGGTEPAVTDANLVLGLIPDELLGGRLRLSREAAVDALRPLAEQIGLSLPEAAEAIYRIVNATMAAAIRQLTVEKGIDPREFSLVSFGGAGGQHAIPVAQELGIESVIFAPQASTFSAMGMLTADLKIAQALTAFGPFDSQSLARARDIVQQLGERAAAELESNVEGASSPELSALLDLRYIGQSHHVSVPFDPKLDDAATIVERFEAAHEQLFGTQLGGPTELVNVRAIISRTLPPITLGGADKETPVEAGADTPNRSRFVALEQRDVPIIQRDGIARDAVIEGPALIEEVDSSHYVPTGWTIRSGWGGAIVAEREVTLSVSRDQSSNRTEEDVHV